ncbi:hypothetical protein RFI_36875 [Reticulomyxa filosa]|uniref:Uncharacterized protein n=1 Tax=Reticulomyxa filosa TaxID=46433 RepID=X6LIN1_RETFI|nr:hypothetical protein RFI_36875 [Reticulomyxa filosa]|eukprot:ETO00565.1 hypothetical protein RFI_36875 [Reticulomyxa filosa]
MVYMGNSLLAIVVCLFNHHQRAANKEREDSPSQIMNVIKTNEEEKKAKIPTTSNPKPDSDLPKKKRRERVCLLARSTWQRLSKNPGTGGPYINIAASVATSPQHQRAKTSVNAKTMNDYLLLSDPYNILTLSNAVTTTQQRDRFDGKDSKRSLDSKHELGGGHFRHELDDTMSESSLMSDTTTLTAISETVTLDLQDDGKTHSFSNAPVATAATQHNALQNVNLSSRLVFHTKANNPNITSANVATQKDPRGKT